MKTSQINFMVYIYILLSVFLCSSCDRRQNADPSKGSLETITTIKIHPEQISYYPYFFTETTSCPLEIMLPSGKMLAIEFNEKSDKQTLQNFHLFRNEGKFMKNGQGSNIFIGGYLIVGTAKKKNKDDGRVTHQFILKDFFIKDDKNEFDLYDFDEGFEYDQSQRLLRLGIISKEQAAPENTIKSQDFLGKFNDWKRLYVRQK